MQPSPQANIVDEFDKEVARLDEAMERPSHEVQIEEVYGFMAIACKKVQQLLQAPEADRAMVMKYRAFIASNANEKLFDDEDAESPAEPVEGDELAEAVEASIEDPLFHVEKRHWVVASRATLQVHNLVGLLEQEHCSAVQLQTKSKNCRRL